MDKSVIEILLVEDNPNDAELALRALKKNNLANNIVIARDGEEALKLLFGSNYRIRPEIGNLPKVILLDLKLPKVDGIEVLRKLKSEESTRSIPVVVLTSSKEEKDIIESYKIGVNSYIVKPVEFNKFVNCVAELGLYWLLLNQPPVMINAAAKGVAWSGM
ncbi:MAG: response regulator [Planctomycetes bacterium]|nr:response regulator [Planctomycetota bacterium]